MEHVQANIEVRVMRGERAELVPLTQLRECLADPDALVWVDIPHCDQHAQALLREVFGFHPVSIWMCANRQRMPKFHPYQDYAFVVLHAPERGEHGHVHYVELDQYIAEDYLVTVHGPTNPAVPATAPLADTNWVWERIREGHGHRPTTGPGLSHAVVSWMALRMEDTLEVITADVWSLEQRVTAGQMGDPEAFLDEMFRTRHGLLAIANMTTASVEVYGRMVAATPWMTPEDRTQIQDNIDQYRRVHRLADGQRDYLQGVIEFYRTRTDTKMTIAAERLAVIAVVTLPITALASIFGMNVIVNTQTDFPLFGISMLVMIAMSAVLLRWAKKQGWW